ncbi:MAG TPA: GatB/YqeY domain-containing protein [Bacilli bacterium]|nr:GatB/YqeY domain-containing protein [Bacilli bacterium]
MIEKLNQDLVVAMKSGDKVKLSVIRGIKGALQLEVINNKKEINDELFISVVSKQIKMRDDSIKEFQKGNRQDLIDSYQKEIDILKKYMPEELTDEEISRILDEVFEEVKPTGITDLGKVMKEVTPKVRGRYDMSKLSILIKEKLNN